MVGSIPLESRPPPLQFTVLEETCEDGDLLAPCTDAVAEWALRRLAAGTPPDWESYWHITEESWQDEVVQLRQLREMRYDDATLILLRVSVPQAVRPPQPVAAPAAVTAAFSPAKVAPPVDLVPRRPPLRFFPAPPGVGAGVGLALPTILSSATADLPQHRTSTGSAVVNMTRQIGSVIGVSVLIALLGTPVGFPAAYDAFKHARFAVALAAVIAAAAALGMTPRPASPALALREEPMMPIAGD